MDIKGLAIKTQFCVESLWHESEFNPDQSTLTGSYSHVTKRWSNTDPLHIP